MFTILKLVLLDSLLTLIIVPCLSCWATNLNLNSCEISGRNAICDLEALRNASIIDFESTSNFDTAEFFVPFNTSIAFTDNANLKRYKFIGSNMMPFYLYKNSNFNYSELIFSDMNSVILAGKILYIILIIFHYQ